jgi:hypothetical protein
MNEGEIDEAVRRYRRHPVLGPATETLSSLREATNRHGDGWAYWPKPVRAAAKLMELIEGDRANAFRDEARLDVTEAKLKAAYVPIKAFRTRCLKEGIKLDFEIVPARASTIEHEIDL